MLALLSTLRLADYLLDPSTVLTHVIAAGLLGALRLQGVSRRVVALVSVTEELFAYLVWIACPSGLTTVAVLWVFLNLYELILGPRLSIMDNAVLTSGDSYVEVVVKRSEGIEFKLTRDDRGQFCVFSTLGCAGFLGCPWFKQIDIDRNICLDDVISINEGCSFDIFKRFRSFGIQREQLMSLVLDSKDAETIVLVARSRAEREHWMVVLHHILGTQITDVRFAWLRKVLSVHYSDKADSDKKTSFDEALDILAKAGRLYDRGYALQICKKITKTNGIKWKLGGESSLNKDQLFSFFSYAVHRPDISEIYNKLIDQHHGKATLKQCRFHEFVRDEQKQDESRETIRQWTLKNEPILRCLNISNIGFSNYLLDDDHSVFKSDCKRVYQDMNQPLSHYFISTSHNTYLTKDQLTSRSSVECYISALKRGCKSVELDIWDGTNSEPVIYHGYTLTSKILVKDVLNAIKEYAFCVSPYPVILSFENHCSTEQQKIVARYVKEIFGGLLYTKSIPDEETSLPSPEDLRGYIIVKGKKLKFDFGEAEAEPEPEEDLDDDIFSDEELPEDLEFIMNRGGGGGDGEKFGGAEEGTGDGTLGRNADVLSLRSEEDEFTSSESIKRRRMETQASLIEIKENLEKIKKNSSTKAKDAEKKLAKEFSDLVVYCQASAFKGFEFAKEKNRHYHMISLAERRAFRLAKEEAIDVMRFSQRQLCRIYPSGARIDSSNFDPVPMWNIGCQMVALNYQTPSLSMQLNQALFQDNAGCGYVLKPKLLTKELNAFDPRKLTDNFQILTIRVISGFQIPYKNEKIIKSERNLSVQVRICGFDSDVQCNRTKVVKNNGSCPVWNEKLTFRIHVPEMAFVVFTVLTKDVYSGHYALPLRCIRQGYRRVPLLNKFSDPEPFAHLFVHISIGS